MNDDEIIIQFSANINVENTLRKFFGLAHPFFLDQLKGRKLNLFTDCSFRDVPHGFYQLLFLIVYFERWDKYIPILCPDRGQNQKLCTR